MTRASSPIDELAGPVVLVAPPGFGRTVLLGQWRRAVDSSGTGPVDDLTRLADLRNSGVITAAEFETIKSRVVRGTTPAS